MDKKHYRADIDGVRALAVISVILFHLDIQTFSGGFVGVDIFFVISGFLITRLIRDEYIETLSFSYSNFYIRRVRRLFPSLFFTFCVCLLFAYSLFAPQHLDRFFGSLLYATFSISNINFWMESGYFDTASEFKPLLHTWSLSVEEQFYFVWPLLIVTLLCKTPNRVLAILSLIGITSLALNFVYAYDRPSIFYLMHFRIFEFAIGAGLVWGVQHQPKNKIISELLVVLGLGLIAYSIFVYTKDTIFPSYNALLPCIGTALLIYSGTAKYSGRLFNNPIAVYTGLISYSLYLIHWPVIVFVKYWRINPLNSTDKILIFVFSIVAAAFMYKFVEQPFRHNSRKVYAGNKVFITVCVSLCILLVIVSTNIWTNDEWRKHYPKTLVDQINFDLNHFRNYPWQRHHGVNKIFSNNEKAKVLVIGDSQAGDFINVLSESNISEHLSLLSIPIAVECQPVFPIPESAYGNILSNKVDVCRQIRRNILSNGLLQEADTVVLASSWSDWGIEFIDSTVQYLKSKGVSQVAIVGAKNQTMDGVKFNAKYAFHKSIHNIRTPVNKIAIERNIKIKKCKSDFLFINLLDYFCTDNQCQRVTNQGHIIIYDTSHLSPEGAKYIAARASSSIWLSSLKLNTRASKHL